MRKTESRERFDENNYRDSTLQARPIEGIGYFAHFYVLAILNLQRIHPLFRMYFFETISKFKLRE